jgi:hypothetical protein
MSDTTRTPPINLKEINGTLYTLQSGYAPVTVGNTVNVNIVGNNLLGTEQLIALTVDAVLTKGGTPLLTLSTAAIPNTKRWEALKLFLSNDHSIKVRGYTDADGSTPVRKLTHKAPPLEGIIDYENSQFYIDSTGAAKLHFELKNLDKNDDDFIDVSVLIRETDTP